MWMPKGVDPEKYAAENGAAPPPPPGGDGGGGNGGCNGGGGAAESTPSTPQLMPSAGGPPSRFSASGSNLSRRGSAARSRYVDTLNPNAGGEEGPAPQQGGGGDNGELAQKLEESQKQLAQYRSQQFAHAQELNSLREELRVAREQQQSVPGIAAPAAAAPVPVPVQQPEASQWAPPPQPPIPDVQPYCPSGANGYESAAPTPDPSYMAAAAPIRHLPTPVKCALSEMPEAPTPPAGAAAAPSQVHVLPPVNPAAVMPPTQHTSAIPPPAAMPPPLMVNRTSSVTGRQPSPMGRAVPGSFNPYAAGPRQLTPRGRSAKNVLTAAVPFDSSGRAPSPRRSDR
jgi:hypothetical protein